MSKSKQVKEAKQKDILLQEELEEKEEELSSLEEKEFITRKRNEQQIEQERLKENKLVRGVFRFHEVPGGSVSFPFRKYKKDKIKKYTFEDGKIYEIPLCVAKHLNQNGSYPIHQHSTDKDGKPQVDVGKTIHRFSFHSLDFIDTSDPDSVATMGPTQIDLV